MGVLPGAVMFWGLLPWRAGQSLFFGDGVAAASLAALAQHRASCRTLIPLKILPLSHQAQSNGACEWRGRSHRCSWLWLPDGTSGSPTRPSSEKMCCQIPLKNVCMYSIGLCWS